MLSSCNITGTLGSITLGVAIVIVTLVDGTLIGTFRGANIGTSLGLTFVLVFLFVAVIFC